MKTPIPVNAASCLSPARHGFLRDLASLPLIGGGIALIGAPTGVAEPATRPLLETYSTWLFYERRMVAIELAHGDHRLASEYEHFIPANNPGDRFFFTRPGNRYPDHPPSTRATLVLSAVGCSWKEGA